MVFGTFDFLHSGHIDFLKQAKRLGNRLIVVVGRDKMVHRVKGAWPIHNEKERRDMMHHIGIVDEAVLGGAKDVYAVIKTYQPQVIALGYDQTAFTGALKKELVRTGIRARVVRLKPHKESVFKSSRKKNREAGEPKHIVVPIAIIVRNGKILMQRRNDLRPDFHGKWEFPGGGMEYGEEIRGNLLREVREETGYRVKIVRLLQFIGVDQQKTLAYSYQVYLLPYVCRIVGGKEQLSDDEVLEIRWFKPDDVLKQPLIGKNKPIYKKILSELKEYIATHTL